MQQIYEDIAGSIFVPGTIYADIFLDLAITVADYEKAYGWDNLSDIHPKDMRLILALMVAQKNCSPVAVALMDAIKAIDLAASTPVDPDCTRKSIGLQITKTFNGTTATVLKPLHTPRDLTNNESSLTVINWLNQFRQEQRQEFDDLARLVIWVPAIALTGCAVGGLIGWRMG